MSIETELVAKLKSDSGFSALVETRIYPLVAPQTVTTPYITYQVISDISNQCLEGGVYQNSTRIQIDCWSTKYSEVKAIKDAVLSAISGFKASNSINTMDDYESDTKLYRQLIDFKLEN